VDSVRYQDIYQDIEKQLFPHGLPRWITEEGQRRADRQITEIVLRCMRDMEPSNTVSVGDTHGE
jgi:hypothetical protein